MEKKVDRTGPRQVCESRRKTPGKNPGPWLRPSSQCHQAGVSTVEFHQVTFHQKSQNMAQLCPNNQEESFNLVEMILPNKILALPPGISNLEQIQKLCQNITSHLHLTISSSAASLSFCLPSFPVSGYFSMSWLFASGPKY